MTNVAVTGIGMVTPLGASREATWRALREGACGLRRLPPDLFDGAESFAGGLPPIEARREGRDRFIGYAVLAAREALADSGRTDGEGVACVVGSSKGGLTAYARLASGKAAPSFLEEAPPGAAAVQVGRDLGLDGPVLAEAASCVTGLACLGTALSLLRSGDCDAVLAGATDASLTPLVLHSYRNMGALSACPDPASACKPFDRRRDGFLVGEGAALLMIEPESAARRRGARVYGSVLSVLLATDPAHVTRPTPSGRPLERALRAALERAETRPEVVDYVLAHGTGTPLGDAAEAAALRSVFGEAAPVGATKPRLGHLLGASAAVEAALLFLALRDGWAPGTPNVDEPDPALGIRPLAPPGRTGRLVKAVSCSAGFGGRLGVLVAERAEGRGGSGHDA